MEGLDFYCQDGEGQELYGAVDPKVYNRDPNCEEIIVAYRGLVREYHNLDSN